MGRPNDPMAVLDSHFRVRGVQGLRVIDAGAMPRITSGNTNSPTLMMAEKAAAWIAAEHLTNTASATQTSTVISSVGAAPSQVVAPSQHSREAPKEVTAS